MEAPSDVLIHLAKRGYFTAFAPMCTGNPVAPNDVLGLVLATKMPHSVTTTYYTSHQGRIVPHDKHNAHSKSYPLITATITHNDVSYTIATVHLYDTYNGQESPEQIASVENLLGELAQLPPHILCGDFNMPRGYNTNYDRFCTRYVDAVPASYTSSLDRTLHRAGTRTDLNAPIFDVYMVDYVFTQQPFQARDVYLQFGLSDHAAVVATITT
jgi:endonuclease/exonuclease/phosphatase family metal-dependent hydrolase